MILELITSMTLHGAIDNSASSERIIIEEFPISLQERKEQFIKELPRGCFWIDTMTYILKGKPQYWKIRWKRAQRLDYSPYMGYSLAWRRRSELKEIVELAKKHGIALE